MRLKVSLLSVLVFMVALSAQAQNFKAVYQLSQRRVPWLADKLVFSSIPKAQEKDVFELSSRNGKICIAASGTNAAAMGLNWYLKYYCHRSMSHMGDNLGPVQHLPMIKGNVRIVAELPLRYALNYCTVNYTMSFYTWKDWERETDWLALNGFNLALMPVGTEMLWQNTLKQIGYTQPEIDAFIPGPAFTAWWLMGNLEGWGGPVSQAVIQQQAALSKKIVSRMQELGIEPAIHGFYGMVPTSLNQKTGYAVAKQGKWVGGFTRPDILMPVDSNWDKLAGIYYREVRKMYGNNIHYFAGDPFHEGGVSKNVDVPHVARLMQHQAAKYFPNSTWVLQGWGNNPSDQLLSGLDKKHAVVIELFGENTNNWETRKAYGGTPFIWSNVSNFGEKVGLYGRLQRFAAEVYRARTGTYGQYMVGTGIIPEGIDNNPVVYDLMAELSWHKDSVVMSNWLKSYVRARYGFENEKLQQAWQVLLQTVYNSPNVEQEGPSESIFCARPGIDLTSVSSWGTRKRNYDTTLFKKAVRLFVEAGDKQALASETYRVDRIDLLRQLQANKGDVAYADMMRAIQDKDKLAFTTAYARFEKLLLQQDSLLNTSPYFSLSRWLQQADNFGRLSNSTAMAIDNAKTQITYWGGNVPATDLRDYAHKEWGGLLSSLYLQRWRAFKAAMLNGWKNEDKTYYFNMEKQWASSSAAYQLKPLPQNTVNRLVKRMIE